MRRNTLIKRAQEMNGVIYWSSNKFLDKRGMFSKILPMEISDNLGDFMLLDAFITHSKKGVIRGMHYQSGSSAGGRIIHVLQGTINDVLLDLRLGSNTYEKTTSMELSAENINSVFVPANIAHGFEANTDTQILYLANKKHNPNLDTGFNPLSIKHMWSCENPTISERDLSLPNFLEKTL
jgi:dTDP-4-dehydrorhamnose 3,5-epimerase